MPELIPHLIVGTALYFIGRYAFTNFFNGNQNTTEHIFLLFICLLFSIIPDAILGIYYATNLLPFDALLSYHNITHPIITLIVIIFSLAFILLDSRLKPIWFLGICATLIYIIIDQFISEYGIFF